MMQDGRIHPSVAMSAPESPATCVPTKVAEFMACLLYTSTYRDIR